MIIPTQSYNLTDVRKISKNLMGIKTLYNYLKVSQTRQLYIGFAKLLKLNLQRIYFVYPILRETTVTYNLLSETIGSTSRSFLSQTILQAHPYIY